MRSWTFRWGSLFLKVSFVHFSLLYFPPLLFSGVRTTTEWLFDGKRDVSSRVPLLLSSWTPFIFSPAVCPSHHPLLSLFSELLLFLLLMMLFIMITRDEEDHHEEDHPHLHFSHSRHPHRLNLRDVKWVGWKREECSKCMRVKSRTHNFRKSKFLFFIIRSFLFSSPPPLSSVPHVRFQRSHHRADAVSDDADYDHHERGWLQRVKRKKSGNC